jgi:hypothetical protein
MPEGMRYEHGKGLSTVNPGEAAASGAPATEPAAPATGLPKAFKGDQL